MPGVSPVVTVEDPNDVFVSEFLGEVMNMAILDSGCTQTVCGEAWLNIFRDSLMKEVDDKLEVKPSERLFRFGDGVVIKSLGTIRIPVSLKSERGQIWINTDIIDKDLPLLMSRSSMKKANTVISFNSGGKEVVTMFGSQQDLYISKSGHICIPLSSLHVDFDRVMAGNHAAQVLFTGNISSMSSKEKERAAEKLHRQFAHPASRKLIKLLKDGGVNEPEFHDLIEKVTDRCDICNKYKKKALTPAVCFPRATEFNEHIAVDLKYFIGKYMLHIIDHFSRYSRGIVIHNKEASSIVDGLIRAWVAIFGPPQSLLSDNGREFDNEKVKELCEKYNINVNSTAAESPWSNGMNERHNGIIGDMVEKLLADGHDLTNAVCWSIAAKNSLANISGYSPNQLVLGKNPQFPSLLSNKAPALEPCRHQDTLFNNLKAMSEARECFIKFEADERLKRALRKKTRPSITEKAYEIGTAVYFERLGQWRGPGTVIGLEHKDVLVKQGGTIYRVPPCRLNRIHEEINSKTNAVPILNQPSHDVQETIPVSRKVIVEDSSGQEVDQRPETVAAGSDVVVPEEAGADNIVEVSGSENSVESSVVIPVDEGSKSVEGSQVEEVEGARNIQTFDNTSLPPLKSLVKCRISDDPTSCRNLRIVTRGGRIGGKNAKWFNVYDPADEDTKLFSVNWDEVLEWCHVDEEQCLAVRSVKDPAIVEARYEELQRWKDFDLYEEVEDEGQFFITVQWVDTQKFVNNNRVVKARLVARGFQERDPIQKDSPTALRESVRFLLMFAVSTNLTIHSLDVKSAFLQGDSIERTVFLKPPKEANSTYLWKLKKCVYGLKDASRAWFLRVYKVLVEDLKMQNIMLDEAVFVWKPGDRVEGLVCLHVDDLIWVGTDNFRVSVISKFANMFQISQQSVTAFKYLGLHISQNEAKINITQQAYIDSVEDLQIDCDKRKQDQSLEKEERLLLKRYVGQLAWAAQHTRPDISFDACETSVSVSTATVGDAIKAKKAYRKLNASLFNVSYVKLADLANCKIWVFSDAAHANLKNYASQLGFVLFLVDNHGNANHIKWCSKKISRVVKSSLAAETLALLEAADNAYFFKRLFESMMCIPNGIDIICFTDNMSIVEHISKSTSTGNDFRLKVDMCCLRDMVNRKEICALHWIEAKLQLADCLTKATASAKNLLDVLKNNRIDIATYLRI